jgi:16S rRNA (guanine966-N2)-methyltransferase
VIKQNLEKVGFADHAAVHCNTARKAIETLNRRYDVVLLDPPYDDSATGDLLGALAYSALIGQDTLLVVSHGDRHPLAHSYGSYVTWKERRYGDSHITIYRREE